MQHALPPRFAITEAQIAEVVEAFYDAVQQHPGLGPVFATHVTDWTAHKAKIVSFWRNAIMMERNYDGNPMAVHKAAGNVRPGMFVPWLALFDRTLQHHLPPETAAAWSDLAHRIGRGLAYGLMGLNEDGTQSGPPKLR